MKQLIFLLSCLISPCIGLSQVEGDSYHPFIEAHKIWHVGNFLIGYNEPHWVEDYYFNGDTIIGTKSYHKWMCRSQEENVYIGALREEEHRVYMIAAHSEIEMTLYDFNAKVGEEIVVGVNGENMQDKCTITHTIPLRIKDRSVTCFKFVDDFSRETFSWNVWMEGIGTKCSPLMNVGFMPGTSKCLINCEVNGQIIYDWRDNPISVIHDIISNYHPFIEEDKQWLTGRFPLGMPQADPFELSTFTFEGDTLVAEKKCKRWVKRTQHFSNSGGYVTTDFVLPLYEEDRQISFFYPDETEPRILYNFNPSNYTFMVYDPLRRYTEGLQCQRTDISYMASIPFRCHLFTTTEYHVNPNSERREEYGETDWFEGLGSMVGPDYNYRMDIDGGTGVLLKCVVGETILYENSIWQEKTDIHDIQIRNSKSIHHSCYDLSGRRVSASSMLPRGVYIRDGKKMVVR